MTVKFFLLRVEVMESDAYTYVTEGRRIREYERKVLVIVVRGSGAT